MRYIFAMTLMQGMYDFALIPFCGDNSSSDEDWNRCRSSQIGIGIFTGISSAACTNVISVLICYVIYFRKRSYFKRSTIYLMIMVPGITLGILGFIYFYRWQSGLIQEEDTLKSAAEFNLILSIYDYWRLVQVVINVVAGVLILYILWSIEVVCTGKFRSRSGSAHGAHAKAKGTYPMFLLAMRLIWYPVAQSVTRFGASWYQFANNETITGYPTLVHTIDDPTVLTAQLFVYVFLVPSCGIAYFLIFLKMQRGAVDELLLLFRYIWSLCGHRPSDEQNSKENIMNTEPLPASERNENSLSRSSRPSSMYDTSRPSSMYDTSRPSSMYDVDESDADDDESKEITIASSDLDTVSIGSKMDSSIPSQSSDSRNDSFNVENKLPVKVTAASLEDAETAKNAGLRYDSTGNSNQLSKGSHFAKSSVSRIARTISTSARTISTKSSSEHLSTGSISSGASEVLWKMRKRSSLKRNSSARNIDAIIDFPDEVDDEIVNELNEDELFDLIVEQQTELTKRSSVRSFALSSMDSEAQHFSMNNSSSFSSSSKGSFSTQHAMPIAIDADHGMDVIIEGDELASSQRTVSSFMDRRMGGMTQDELKRNQEHDNRNNI